MKKESGQGISKVLLRFVGYLLPFIQSLPSLGVWTGLMTLPFASYLILVFSNLTSNLPSALSELFGWLVWPFLIPEKALVMFGLFIFFSSAVYLRVKKKDGLVTSGPYRLIRHPQYLGMTLSTLGLTSWSIWILQNTFGIGFLSPLQTIVVWFIMLAAYIVLASLEEIFLSKSFGARFENYRTQVPFMIPLFKTNRRSIDLLASVVVPAFLLLVLIFSNKYLIQW